MRRVLVVDDDPTVLEVTARILRDAGYLAVEAPNARVALRLLKGGDPPINLVITDVVMPETDGRSLGRMIGELHPGLPIIYVSAYPSNDVFHRGAPDPLVPFLQKPFSPDALLSTVRELFATAPQAGMNA